MKRVIFAVILALVLGGCAKEDLGEYYPDITNRELHYISRSGEKVEFDDDDFDAPIISNIYENGKGVITFASPLQKIYFLGSLDITSITIPTSVSEFEGNPFYKCENLVRFVSKYSTSDGYALVKNNEFVALARNYRGENYEIAYGIKSIGERALYGAKITGVTIPNSVATIADEAFAECDNLQELILPERIESLGRGVCSKCTRLNHVSLPKNVVLQEEFAGFVGCVNLERFSGAFASMDGRCLIVDKAIYAFAPKDVADYTITDDVTAIAPRAFAQCDRLKSISIPEGVRELGGGVFYNCTHLEKITLAPTTPPAITRGEGSADLFGNLPDDYIIYVPMSSVAKYKGNSDWARYDSHIEGKNL